jgi:hypothetical protein
MEERSFISRLDGSVKDRRDFEARDLSGLPNIFATDQELSDAKAVDLTIKTLGHIWDIDKDLLLRIACYFVSVDESNNFIEVLDSEGWSLEHAWSAYCAQKGRAPMELKSDGSEPGPDVVEINPFLMEMDDFAAETKGYRDYIKHKY